MTGGNAPLKVLLSQDKVADANRAMVYHRYVQGDVAPRIVFTPAALAYLAEIAEEQAQDRGSVMGVYSVLLSLGQLSGTALAGPFAERAGFNGLITLTGLLCLIALFTVLLLGRSERRQRLTPQAA